MIYDPIESTDKEQEQQSNTDGKNPLEHMPLELLPGPFKDMANAIVETARVPSSLAGCCTLGALSASIGSGLRVQSGPERYAHSNLYLLASAISGSGKSEAFRIALSPFFDAEKVQLRQWRETTLPCARAEMELVKSEIEILKKEVHKNKNSEDRKKMQDEMLAKQSDLIKIKEKLMEPYYSTEDATSQVLEVRLKNPSETIAMLSADAGSIVNNLLGRFNKLNRTDETIYLKAWSGDYTKVDRLSRNSVILEHPRMTALWLVQPDKIDTLIGEKSLSDGGLIPRLLFCHTNCRPTPMPELIEPIPQSVHQAYSSAINQLLAALHNAPAPYSIQPTKGAQKLFIEHYNLTALRMANGDLQDVTPFASRWTEQAWRISVCLHAGENLEYSGSRELTEATTEKAIQLTNWFAAHQLVILEDSRSKRREIRFKRLAEILAGNNGCISFRSLKGSNGIGEDEINELVKHFPDKLAIETKHAGPTGGRPSKLVRLIEK